MTDGPLVMLRRREVPEMVRRGELARVSGGGVGAATAHQCDLMRLKE